MTDWDVVVIGGAPAGLSAALFAARRGLRTLILTKNIGGQIATTVDVENYPGIPYIEGHELSHVMREQAIKAGAQIVLTTAQQIKQIDQKFSVSTATEVFTTRAIILTHGKIPRNLGVPGEAELLGHGVHYSAGHEIKQYTGKPVAIVGGGDSAFTAAKQALAHCPAVWLIHHSNQFRASSDLTNQVLGNSQLHLKTESTVTRINGSIDSGVESIQLMTPKGEVELKTAAIFIEIGFAVDTQLVKNLVKLNELNHVVVDSRQATSLPGIFAAGDITDNPYNQAIISAGDGARAALAAYSYLNGGKPVSADWGKN